LYRDKLPSNPNLPDAIRQVGLEEESKRSASDYLIDYGIPPEILYDVVQPTARAVFVHNLGDLNALSALIAMNPADLYHIDKGPRGNSELVFRLIRLSESRTQLNAQVSKISRSINGKYTIKVSRNDTDAVSTTEDDQGYDSVVVATPLQGARINFGFPVPLLDASLPPFSERHVT
jgi:protoporphyrinogen oxidase